MQASGSFPILCDDGFEFQRGGKWCQSVFFIKKIPRLYSTGAKPYGRVTTYLSELYCEQNSEH